jgi:transcriptional regulator with XRE-family HTH domain
MSPNRAKQKTTADDIIDRLREQQGLNYSQLSRASAIPRPTLCNKIEHIDRFTLAELKRLSAALNVELTDLLERAA